MGTTAEKLTYLGTTKGLIAESINNLGGSIDSETTFREYAEELDNIYSNLPKVTGENTEVTLTPTLKGKLGIVEKGNSTQESTTGKNLYPTGTKFTPTQVIWVDNYGNDISSVAQILSNENYLDLIGGQAYTFKINEYANIKAIQVVYLDNSTIKTLVNVANDTLAHTFTPATNTRIWVRYSVNTANQETYIIAQIEKGSTATNYEQYTGGIPAPNPSYPFPIKSVTGDNNVVVRNSDNTQSQTLPLNLGNIELNKIGTYQDYIYKNNDKWYKKEQIGKTTLNTVTQVRSTTIFGVTKKYITQVISDMLSIASVNYNFFCNKISKANGVANDYAGYTTYNSFLAMVNDNDTTTTLNNNLAGADIYYVKATAADIELTDTDLIAQLENIDKVKGYNGTTIITSTFDSNNAQMILSVSGLKGE